ncbi:MAG: N-acetylglucosamine-6-phosphate deacetylase [Armatimonadetes bacterium]|nr:N-acetylglucosamine-6-phosphate deacetylase [Armatimonadota bacterium]
MRLYGNVPGTTGLQEVVVEGERIVSLSPAAAGTPPSDLVIAPAFMDIQINGYGGRAFGGPQATPDTLAYVVRAQRQAGVLFICPTLVTASHEHLLHALRALAQARRDPEIAHASPCIHMEGPYISPEDGPRGAHALQHVRPPDWDEFRRLQDAAEGAIGIVTLAPEQPGSTAFIERLVEAGVVAALGHTGATPEQIHDAVRAGARLSTHLGNGSHARIDRHPNYIWEQLAADDLCASIIVDGHHLPPSVVQSFVRAKGVDRTILISDAVAAAGLPPGVYEGDGKQIEVLANGRVQLKDTPYLAGSGLILPRGIENVVRFAGVTLAEAVQMATVNPARLLGLQERLGTVAPGREANLCLFRWNAEACALTIEAVVVRGRYIAAAEMGDALAATGTQVF